MKKAGIITLNGYFNYGNRLQNYALQKTLLNFFDEVETIWYTKKEYIPMQFQWNWKMIVKYILNYNNFRKYIHDESYVYDILQNVKLKGFTEKYINTRYRFEELDAVSAKEYDYFVVGSDQIWQPMFISGETEFLTFAPSSKRVAYAPSIVKEDLSIREKKKYRKFLLGMKAVSVRSSSDAVTVKKLIGKDVPVLIDPTMLLLGDEWRKIADFPSRKDNYIFVFLIGKKTQQMKDEIDFIANKYQLQIIDFQDKSNLDVYAASPTEWIGWIDRATLVYTDSFHGVAFSIILHTSFYTRSRHNINGIYTRILTLTKRFHMVDRMLERDEIIMDGKNHLTVDFSDTNSILIEEKNRSFSYLRKAFQEDIS